MTETELQRSFYASIEDVISLIPPPLVTENEVGMLSRYFSRTKQGTTESYQILLFVAKLSSQTASELFYSLNFEVGNIAEIPVAIDAETREVLCLYQLERERK